MKREGRKQKLLGVALVLISIMSAILTEGDITFLMVFLPLGIYIIATEENFVVEAEAEMETEATETERAEIKLDEIRAENKSCFHGGFENVKKRYSR